MPLDAPALRLTLQVAASATVAAVALGTLLAYALPRNRWTTAGTAIPLAFPPTIVCAYFLLPSLSWPLAALAGVVYAAPFLLRSARNAFDGWIATMSMPRAAWAHPSGPSSRASSCRLPGVPLPPPG